MIHLDHFIAIWFHTRLTPAWARMLHAMSDPGGPEWIGFVVLCLTFCLVWKRHWRGLATVLLTIPGGLLLCEGVKLLVHRHRPYVVGPFVDWSGYSFPSGHTTCATLLYGLLCADDAAILQALEPSSPDDLCGVDDDRDRRFQPHRAGGALPERCAGGDGVRNDLAYPLLDHAPEQWPVADFGPAVVVPVLATASDGPPN